MYAKRSVIMNFSKKDYAETIAILCGVTAGALCGIFLPSTVPYLKPIGDIFINFIFVLVVPLVFFSISSSFCRMIGGGNAGRTVLTTLAVFLLMSVAFCIIGYAGCMIFKPFEGADGAAIIGSAGNALNLASGKPGDIMVNTLSAPDFSLLLTKSNLLPLIIFSAIFGICTAKCGKKADGVRLFLDGGNEVMIKMMDLLMKAAPLGLGCYFAGMLSSFGNMLLKGYAGMFVTFIILATICYFIVNSLMILAFRGVPGLKSYWSHILPPSIIAFATASSVAAMPAGIDSAKKMGISPEIAESCLPLGTNIHKDGSALAGVMKVIFLITLAGGAITRPHDALAIIGIAILSALVMGAIPSGGCTGELLTCTLLGVDPSLAGIIIIFGTLVDMPTTLVNASTNVVAANIVDSICGKKTRNRSNSDCKNQAL